MVLGYFISKFKSWEVFKLFNFLPFGYKALISYGPSHKKCFKQFSTDRKMVVNTINFFFVETIILRLRDKTMKDKSMYTPNDKNQIASSKE